jgi:hypothetical protein
MPPDLRGGMSASDRERPFVAGYYGKVPGADFREGDLHQLTCA